MEILNRSQRYYQIISSKVSAVLVFIFLMSLMRYIFYFMTRYRFDFVEWETITNAFFMGLRFDLLVLGFFGIPIVTVFAILVAAGLNERLSQKLLGIYLALVWIIITISSYVSLPYYMMKERHFRWGEDDSFFIWPLVDNTTIILNTLVFVLILGLGLRYALEKRKNKPSIFTQFPKVFQLLIHFILPLILVALAARGTLTPHHLEKAHSEISPWPHVNELVLNSVWCIDK